MRRLAEGVWQLSGLVPHLINTYLVRTVEGDVLIDAGVRWTTWRTLSQLRGRKLALMALTHVHPDHQGAAAAVCREFQVPLACHTSDADTMEGKQPMGPDNLIVRVGHRLMSGPPHPVGVRWRGGERIGEWRVIPTPGHTLGHVIFFRERDRTAISGDLFRNWRLGTGVRLSEPPHFFSVDPLLNRRSLAVLAGLRPHLICPGHGSPFHDSGEVERLARRLGFAPRVNPVPVAAPPLQTSGSGPTAGPTPDRL